MNRLALKKLKKTFQLQLDQSDCGVACLKSLVNYYGGDISLEKLREHSGTSKQGTTLLGLYQAAGQIGFTARGCEADLKALKEHGQPLILHVTVDNRLQHYVICYGFENNRFVIGDPGKGIVYYMEEELQKIWLSKGCLTLVPNQTFQKSTAVKKDRKKWFLNLLQEDKEILMVSVIVGIGIAVLGMVMAVFSQKLIDDILPSKDLQKLIVSIILVAFLLIARAGFVAIRQYFLITQSKSFNNRIIRFFYNALLYLPKSFFDTRRTGELVARLNDTARIQRVITQMAGNYIIDSLIAVTSIVFLMVYSWQTGIIALLCMPFYFLMIYRYNKIIISSQKEVMSAYAFSESNYVNTMSGITEIKSSNKQPFFAELNKTIYENFQNKVFDLGKINVKLSFIAGFMGVIFLVLVLLYNSYQVYADKMLVGSLMAVLGISSSLLPSISNLALIAIPVNEAKIAFHRMYEFTSIKPEEESKDKGTSEPLKLLKLEIKNIAFRFPGRKRILEDINLSVKKGELISMVGESGSGKSTLGYLLQKFYAPESGKIVINGDTSFQDIKANHWRDLVGVVPQDIHIFNGNVIDNICLSNAQHEIEKVLLFLKEYGFLTYVESLPQGYATILGEEGINLSGGQKQIIALARALYKKPQFLILDEATAAMDREAEKFTIALLEKLKKEIAVFYISHRLHVLKNISDKIYILENGRIQASGLHKELITQDNMYSNYWKDFAEV